MLNNDSICMCILGRKEIENYLLVPSAISRFLKKQGVPIASEQLNSEIAKLIGDLCDQAKKTVFNKRLDYFSHQKKKGTESSTILEEFTPIFERNWGGKELRISFVPGKLIFGQLSEKCKPKYNVSFGELQIASIMTAQKIDQDLVSFLTAIKEHK